mmetsp:Transcript_99538/g.171342  ORF Transcript_99538/g.171342 Transcript_99538/m.171342 type:complete len:202 (+) Transcript_99538:1688-2293(+)
MLVWFSVHCHTPSPSSKTWAVLSRPLCTSTTPRPFFVSFCFCSSSAGEGAAVAAGASATALPFFGAGLGAGLACLAGGFATLGLGFGTLASGAATGSAAAFRLVPPAPLVTMARMSSSDRTGTPFFLASASLDENPPAPVIRCVVLPVTPAATEPPLDSMKLCISFRGTDMVPVRQILMPLRAMLDSSRPKKNRHSEPWLP